jgi:RNA polymerase sigma factor (TIGR02999 family)
MPQAGRKSQRRALITEIPSVHSTLRRGWTEPAREPCVVTRIAADISQTLYEEVRRIAAAAFERERAGNVLQPTAVAHEAVLRIAGQDEQPESPEAWLAAAAVVVRRALVDEARRRDTKKRGQGWRRTSLTSVSTGQAVTEVDVLDLHESLDRLVGVHERTGRVLEFRYFGGMTVEQIATHLGVSARTVKGDCAFGLAWLSRDLSSTA